jgi:hypothetical protein
LNTVSSVIDTLGDGLKTSLKVLDEKIENIKALDELSGSFKQNIN